MSSFSRAIRLACLGVVVGFVSWAPGAQAISFSLLDHGHGNEGAHYGLRLDAEMLFFSVEDEGGLSRVSLDWVPGESEATIEGILREVDPSTNASGDDWDVLYELTGVNSVFDGATLIGFEATAGIGSVELGMDVIPLVGKAEMGSDIVFRFLADGLRIPGDDDTLVGRGWLLGNGGLNDWLVRSPDVIPEPATALLLGLGLVALGGVSRRRRLAS